MQQSAVIRCGIPADANALAVLATQVWLHTYATDGVSTDIAEYVLAELTPAKYSATLKAPMSRLFVAEHENSVIGFATVALDVQCPASDRSTAELQTLYVQEHFTGNGVGKSLLRAAEAAARKERDSLLWLTANAKNSRAIGFYEHLGYSKIGTAYFAVGAGRHENHLLIGQRA